MEAVIVTAVVLWTMCLMSLVTRYAKRTDVIARAGRAREVYYQFQMATWRPPNKQGEDVRMEYIVAMRRFTNDEDWGQAGRKI